MARPGRSLRLIVLAAALCLRAGLAASLEPGIAMVESRDRQQLRFRLDRDSKVYPAQLQGLIVVVRRQVQKVYAPQAWRPFAEEWQENGTAVVLPIHKTGGDFIGRLVTEDIKHPVKPGDRVEVAPAQVVWLEADVVSFMSRPTPCTWTCDAGVFLLPGGIPAGKDLTGPSAVQWQAPAEPTQQVTVGLRVSAGPRAKPSEQQLAIRVAAPTGDYAEAGRIRTRVPSGGRGALGPLFAEAGRIAAGPPGIFCLVDGPGKRLLRWVDGVPHYSPLSGQVVALASSGATAFVATKSSALPIDLPSGKASAAVALPGAKRFVGLATNAVGDLFVLDSGAPPGLHILAAGTTAWQAAPLEPRVDSPWLRSFAVDPTSNDVFVADTRDRMVRHWRAQGGGRYRLLPVAIAIGKAIDKHGEPIAILPRTDRDTLRDLPVQLVFKSGAVTDKWTSKGEPPRWEPEMAPLARALFALRFEASQAARLPGGDLLVSGRSTASGAKGPALVQVSPRGEFRRMLPLPDAPPRLVAVAPDARRYVVLGPRGRRDPERLIVVDQDGWLAHDFGPLQGYHKVLGLRPDRGSSGHVLIVGERTRRQSVFRVDAAEPDRTLELSSAGLPGGRIPDHEAIDVASTPDRIVVLDSKGKVIVFTNTRPIRVAGHFDTGLREPKAIALLGKVGKGGAKSYVCVLEASKRAPAVHVWELRLADAGKLLYDRIGAFPDPERGGAGARLASPRTLDSAFPDSRGTLFVLDAGGKRLRVFDAAAIAERLQNKLPAQVPAKAAIEKLAVKGEGLDLSVGPGQSVHIADPKGECIQIHRRRP